MKKVQFVIFRYLTFADFFNIYKPAGAEKGGGGQTYIDFGIRSIRLEDWESFFQGATKVVTNKDNASKKWEFPVRSTGNKKSQTLTIYRRRPQSFSIAAQRLGSANSNRVSAWHPDYGFPQPIDPSDRHSKPNGLAIYLVRCTNGEIWAGWFQDKSPFRDALTTDTLREMTSKVVREGFSGYLDCTDQDILLDEEDVSRPFYSTPLITAKTKKSNKVLQSEEDDVSNELLLQDLDIDVKPQEKVIQYVLKRNQKAVRYLKRLYKGECQLTGKELTFIKPDGNLYSEAHHLIPLGSQGADSPYNIIIVSPLIHRMLHYANIDGLDLSKITPENTLEIKINDKPYVIRWHPSHADTVRKQQA